MRLSKKTNHVLFISTRLLLTSDLPMAKSTTGASPLPGGRGQGATELDNPNYNCPNVTLKQDLLLGEEQNYRRKDRHAERG